MHLSKRANVQLMCEQYLKKQATDYVWHHPYKASSRGLFFLSLFYLFDVVILIVLLLVDESHILPFLLPVLFFN